jgi:nicotinamide-nucleotide amidase
VSGEPARALAAEVIGLLRARGQTLVTAESLTGGLVCAALTGIPGASDVVRGGIIAYATDVKAAVLGVGPALLTARGAVDPEVAAEMADGARARLGADVAVATTGVAGPGPAEGKPAGTVHIAVATGGAVAGRALALAGGRAEVRGETVTAALTLLRDVLREETK